MNKNKPEIKYRAMCARCDKPLNAYRGFTDGRVYNHKTDGLQCEACGKTKVPTLKKPMLSNLEDVEAQLKETQNKMNSLFEQISNMKAGSNDGA